MTIIDTSKDLAALFVQQAQATPDAVVLEDESRSLTYAELDREKWALAELLRDYGVGRETLVGVLMGRCADYVIACLATLPCLRSLWLNGEVVPADLAARALNALPQTTLFNVYSASETHEVAAGDVRSCLKVLAGAASGFGGVCPVGPPLDPGHTYVLDEAGNRVGVGEVGELYVGGDMLARGYLNLPETTAKAF